MKLVCLGTTGYHPSASRQTASYLIADLGVMLDAGTGAFRAKDYLGEHQVLVVLLSHAHLDHVVGLTYLLDVVYATSVREVHVYGEQSKIDGIQKHLFSETLFPVLPSIQWHAIDAQPEFTLKPSGAKVTWWHQEHPGGSVGYRIDHAGKSMAYVTDTIAQPEHGQQPNLLGLDLLLHECNFRDEESDFARKTGHSWTTAVARLAKIHSPGTLALIHTNPLREDTDPIDLPKARSIYPKTILPSDCDVIEY